MRTGRLLLRLLAMIPLEGAICLTALVMVFAGAVLVWGVGSALLVTGAVVLFLEFWPSIVVARKR